MNTSSTEPTAVAPTDAVERAAKVAYEWRGAEYRWDVADGPTKAHWRERMGAALAAALGGGLSDAWLRANEYAHFDEEDNELGRCVLTSDLRRLRDDAGPAAQAQASGFAVGSCARCGKPILVPASDPENHEMDVCGGCGLAVGISEGRAGGVSARDGGGTRPSSAATPAGRDELEPVQTHAYARFEWDCGACGETHDERDIDPAYEKRTCDACRAVNEIGETR